MFFAWDITIDAGTTAGDPKTQILKLSKGVIVKVDIKFPRGCHGFALVRLKRGDSQLYPLNMDEWASGDNETIEVIEHYELIEMPYQLKFEGCSPAAFFQHTITVRITILPKAIASLLPVIDLMMRFLRKLGIK